MPLPVSYTARQDSGSANNPAINLTGAPAIDITFVAETDTGGAGDLFLDQPTGGGVDPDTQVEIAGTSYSFIYELSGTLPTLKKDGSQQVPDQYEGSDVVIITVQDYPLVGYDGFDRLAVPGDSVWNNRRNRRDGGRGSAHGQTCPADRG